jgi:hypothetical protein
VTGGRVDERQQAVEALAKVLRAELLFPPGYSEDLSQHTAERIAGDILDKAELVPKAELDRVASERDDLAHVLGLEPDSVRGELAAYMEANVAQRAELDVALRQRAEAERERDAKKREAESLVWEMGKQKAAAESRAEAAEAERDDLRRRVGELERTLIGELCGDKTCARCSKFRAALARETSPAGEGDN